MVGLTKIPTNLSTHRKHYDNSGETLILNELNPDLERSVVASGVVSHGVERSGKVPLGFSFSTSLSTARARGFSPKENVARDKILDFERIPRPSFIFNGKPFGLSLEDMTHSSSQGSKIWPGADRESSPRLCAATSMDGSSRLASRDNSSLQRTFAVLSAKVNPQRKA